jgi:hypothetical protein
MSDTYVDELIGQSDLLNVGTLKHISVTGSQKSFFLPSSSKILL